MPAEDDRPRPVLPPELRFRLPRPPAGADEDRLPSTRRVAALVAAAWPLLDALAVPVADGGEARRRAVALARERVRWALQDIAADWHEQAWAVELGRSEGYALAMAGWPADRAADLSDLVELLQELEASWATKDEWHEQDCRARLDRYRRGEIPEDGPHPDPPAPPVPAIEDATRDLLASLLDDLAAGLPVAEPLRVEPDGESVTVRDGLRGRGLTVKLGRELARFVELVVAGGGRPVSRALKEDPLVGPRPDRLYRTLERDFPRIHAWIDAAPGRGGGYSLRRTPRA